MEILKTAFVDAIIRGLKNGALACIQNNSDRKIVAKNKDIVFDIFSATLTTPLERLTIVLDDARDDYTIEPRNEHGHEELEIKMEGPWAKKELREELSLSYQAHVENTKIARNEAAEKRRVQAHLAKQKTMDKWIEAARGGASE
jgi:hypothetical protein